MTRQAICGLRAAILMAAVCTAHAQSFTILTTFHDGFGSQPGQGPLARDTAGNLYGASPTSANTQNCVNFACGLIYKVDATGKTTVLYTFTGPPDGSFPEAVIADAQGNLYGTTQYGGAYNQGTVFKLDPAGNETILHSFAGSPDGANPISPVVRDPKGNLYGVTPYGGTINSSCTPSITPGCGVVFKITPAGEETVLYRFSGGTDGGIPSNNLLLVGATLYGTTGAGGELSCAPPNGCGTVFKLRGGTENVLYSFKGSPDGRGGGYIVRDRAGNIYGTSGAGGDTSQNCPFGDIGCGTVFEVSPGGAETILYTFHEPFGADGLSPIDVTMGAQGNLYGSTINGTVFEVDTSGIFSLLWSAASGNAGSLLSMVKLDDEGNLYGTTDAVVFMITP